MIWEPAIYEHKAALISRPAGEVSRDAGLLAEALLAEAKTYGADYITVGIDVYNLEAEACGAELVETSPGAAAEIPRPPWSLESEFASETVPAQPDFWKTGRFRMVLEAAERARDSLALPGGGEAGAGSHKASIAAGDAATRPAGVRAGDSARGRPVLRVAASGPVSIAAKLVGAEDLLIAAATEDPAALRVLDFATRLTVQWAEMIRSRGFDVLIVDSSASPPLFSPALYRSAVAPFHRRVMSALEDSGQEVRPLIMGGNTVEIAADLVATGANSLICDFAADAGAFAKALTGGAASPGGATWAVGPRVGESPADWREAGTATDESDGDAGGEAGAKLPPDGLVVRRNIAPAAINDLASRDARIEQTVADLRALPGAVLGTGILPYDQDPKTVVSFRDGVRLRVE